LAVVELNLLLNLLLSGLRGLRGLSGFFLGFGFGRFVCHVNFSDLFD
jgi:hypothetical protein